jgi:predicted metal-binding membrane protein
VASPVRILSALPGTTLAAAGLSVVGWLGLAALSYGDADTGPICSAPAVEVLHPGVFVGWGFMALAMTGPLFGGPLHHLWHRSLARHRVRNIVLFISTYIAIWCLVYVLFTMVLVSIGASLSRTLPVLVLTTAIAIAWQFSPHKRKALLRCHLRPPLSVFGYRAWLDPIWFAVRRGAWCVLSCWALMLVPFAAQSVLLMLIATAISSYEQVFRLPAKPISRAWPDWVSRTRRPVAHQPASQA